MGCCSVNNTTAPPFKYSPSQLPLPKERTMSRTYARLESPKTQGFLNSICAVNAPNGQFACGWDKTLAVYDLGSRKIVHQFQPHAQNISKCRFLLGGTHILTSSFDRTLKLWNLENQLAPKKTYEGHSMAVSTFCVSQDQTKLCSGSRDQSVMLWDLQTGQSLATKLIPRNMITCVEWIPGSNDSFVQCSEDLTIRIWDTREFKPVIEIALGDNYFAANCDVDSTGTKLVTGHFASNGEGCGVLLWDLRKASEGSYMWRFIEHKESVVQTAIVKNGHAGQDIVISASKDAKVKVIKMADGVELSSYQDPARWPFTSFSPTTGAGDKPVVVAGLCKNCISKVTALELADDFSMSVTASTDED